MSDQQAAIVASIEKLDVRSGDLLWAKVGHLSGEQAQMIVEGLRRSVPDGVRVVVTEPDVSLDIIREALIDE